ncbi:unannotated protein [freshwater metagenome]|uniref:Unannotated protein n=1 Tax=freshwater metagenome TaxID=449393 RepID=A0A6J7VX40_9ZZZZ
MTLLDIPESRNAGTPNPTSKMIKINGAPRKISTYAVARNLNGVSAGDLVVRIRAKPRAMTPIQAPPIKVNCRLIQRPAITVGRTSRPYSISKNVFLTTSQPGEETTMAMRAPITRIEDRVAINPCLRLIRLRAIARSASRELGDHAELIRSVMVAKLPCLLLSFY